jgi:CRISPR/Cas system-associated exonuclease Cas4 (RecB family)
MFSQDPLDSGKFVHDSIHRYYANYYLTSGTADDILSITYNILKNMWDTTLPAIELHKAYTCLRNHSLFEYNNIQQGIMTNPMTEVKMSTDVFFGIIDYIDLHHDKVIDWKSNKIAMLSYEYKIQAYIYKLLFEETFKRPINHFTFYFLYPNEIRTVRYDSEGMNGVKEDVDQMMTQLKEMMNTGEFPKQPRTENGCNNCSYRLYCKY